MQTSILDCGPTSFLLTVLGIAGFVAAIFALVMMSMRSNLATLIAGAAIVIGAASLTLGAISSNSASGGLLALAMDAKGQDREQLIAHAGDAAKLCLGMGLKGGLLPITAGIIAMVVTLVRKKRPSRI